MQVVQPSQERMRAATEESPISKGVPLNLWINVCMSVYVCVCAYLRRHSYMHALDFSI